MFFSFFSYFQFYFVWIVALRFMRSSSLMISHATQKSISKCAVRVLRGTLAETSTSIMHILKVFRDSRSKNGAKSYFFFFFLVWDFSNRGTNRNLNVFLFFHFVIFWIAWAVEQFENARNGRHIRNSISPFSCNALLLIHTYVNRITRTIAATKFHIHTLFSYKTFCLREKKNRKWYNLSRRISSLSPHLARRCCSSSLLNHKSNICVGLPCREARTIDSGNKFNENP